jgi:hypothetical protein
MGKCIEYNFFKGRSPNDQKKTHEEMLNTLAIKEASAQQKKWSLN